MLRIHRRHWTRHFRVWLHCRLIHERFKCNYRHQKLPGFFFWTVVKYQYQWVYLGLPRKSRECQHPDEFSICRFDVFPQSLNGSEQLLSFVRRESNDPTTLDEYWIFQGRRILQKDIPLALMDLVSKLRDHTEIGSTSSNTPEEIRVGLFGCLDYTSIRKNYSC